MSGETPAIGLFYAPCRSGGTALLQTIAQNPTTECYSQGVKRGLQEKDGKPDYAFFGRKPANGHTMIIDKESIGYSNEVECGFNVFPNEGAILQSRPVLLLRDPVDTWNSWARLKWNFELFRMSYRTALDTFEETQQVSTHGEAVTYEQLSQDPDNGFRTLCAYWGIAYDENMQHWKYRAVGDDPRVDRTKRSQKHFDTEVHSSVRSSNHFYRIHKDLIISMEEVEQLEDEFREAYLRIADVSTRFLEEVRYS